MPATSNVRAAAFAAALGFALCSATSWAQERATAFSFGQSDAPIEIESDKLELRDRDRIAIFSGNVTLIQGDLLLRTARMTVYYSGSGEGGMSGSTDIERMEASGKVYIKQNNQVATGDQGYVDMAANVMVLTGKEVRLSEDGNIVVGCKLTVTMDTGLSQLDGCGAAGADGGRVKMLLQPGN